MPTILRRRNAVSVELNLNEISFYNEGVLFNPYLTNVENRVSS